MPAIDSRPASDLPATTPSRRAFLSVAAIAASGLVLPAYGVATNDRSWEIVREIIASGEIGLVQVASAIVPCDAGEFTSGRILKHLDAPVPARIADTFMSMLAALSCDRPTRMQTAVHNRAASFSMTCALEGGQTVAIASASAGIPFSATIRGGRGALYVSDNAVSIESAGSWREVQI